MLLVPCMGSQFRVQCWVVPSEHCTWSRSLGVLGQSLSLVLSLPAVPWPCCSDKVTAASLPSQGSRAELLLARVCFYHNPLPALPRLSEHY